MLSEASSKSYSSSMSPTICSSTSSMVTRPATPPYSSITMAMWLRLARDSRRSHVRGFAPGAGGDRARGAAVFVDHDGHVVAAGAELAQQHVEALRLGDEDRGAQHFT